MTTNTSYTPGPLTVSIDKHWPFRIITKNANGEVVFATAMPYWSSRDKTPEDTINCVNFPPAERAKAAAANRRAIADEVLRAAAPELLEALELLLHIHDSHDLGYPAAAVARAAIVKAKVAMTPMLKWVFSVTCDATGRVSEHEESAPVVADEFALCAALEKAGYRNVKLLRKEWPAYARPGGHRLFYICADAGVLCPKCANDNIALTSDKDANADWRVIGAEVNYEDCDLICDHCGQKIAAAYDY